MSSDAAFERRPKPKDPGIAMTEPIVFTDPGTMARKAATIRSRLAKTSVSASGIFIGSDLSPHPLFATKPRIRR